MTIFGNRDFGQRDLGVVHADTPGTDTPTTDAPGSPAQEVDRAEEAPVRAFGVDIRRVMLRVHGGEDIVVGEAEGRDPAVEIARDLVRHIEAASAKGEWPQIDERFIRPGAIVSVDVQRAE